MGEVMQALETNRLRLEPLMAGHAAIMFAGLSDPSLYTCIAADPPASLAALQARYLRLQARRSENGEEAWLNWIVLAKPGLLARGYVQATVAGSSAQVAYVLFRDAWRQGIAREAMERMLMHLREACSVRNAIATAMSIPAISAPSPCWSASASSGRRSDARLSGFMAS